MDTLAAAAAEHAANKRPAGPPPPDRSGALALSAILHEAPALSKHPANLIETAVRAKPPAGLGAISSCTEPPAGADPPRERKRRTRTVTTPNQARVLTEVLNKTQFPSTEQRERLAKELKMTPRTVQVWFQNQRQKAKHESGKRGMVPIHAEVPVTTTAPTRYPPQVSRHVAPAYPSPAPFQFSPPGLSHPAYLTGLPPGVPGLSMATSPLLPPGHEYPQEEALEPPHQESVGQNEYYMRWMNGPSAVRLESAHHACPDKAKPGPSQRPVIPPPPSLGPSYASGFPYRPAYPPSISYGPPLASRPPTRHTPEAGYGEALRSPYPPLSLSADRSQPSPALPPPPLAHPTLSPAKTAPPLRSPGSSVSLPPLSEVIRDIPRSATLDKTPLSPLDPDRGPAKRPHSATLPTLETFDPPRGADQSPPLKSLRP